MLRRLTDLALRRPLTVVAGWAAVVVLAVVSAPALFASLTSDVGDADGTESQRAANLLWHAAPSGESIFAVADGRAASDPGLRASVGQAADGIAAMPGVDRVLTPWTGVGRHGAPDPGRVSTDGNAVVIEVDFKPTPAGAVAVDSAADRLRAIDAPTILVGGGPLLDDEKDAQAAHDLARAELISLPVLLILLLVIFGGAVAAGLPLVIAVVSSAAAMAALLGFSLVADVSVYAINIVTMLGIGLGVDYALLIVTRFREERQRTVSVDAAVAATMASAGRTVFFSGLTVAASLAGLLVFPDDFLRSMGFAGLSVVLLDMLAAVTLVPALLSKVGHRISPSRPREDGHGVFASTARWAGRHPMIVIPSVVVVLGLAALPFASVRFADPDQRSLPASSPTRQLADIAQTRFAQVSTADPIDVVLTDRVPRAELDQYAAALADLPGVRSASTPQLPGLSVVEVTPQGDSQGELAISLVHQIRALDAPAPVVVGGDAAELVDYESSLTSRLPYAIGLVAAATFALLFLFTGSVVVPLKALAMNAASLGASFGALVWVFQDGHLGGLVGTDALGSLSITTPTLVLAIAFGLSMDYEVFLLGRISEVWRRTGDTTHAVVVGLQRTGRVVTAAAALMVVVYAAFASGGFSPVKQLGVGMILAIVVDATLIRMLLLPAVMTLMGRSNWWSPPAVRRWHARHGLREVDVSPVVGEIAETPAVALAAADSGGVRR
jgi:RND superfamily putative drug exporter